MRAAVISSFGPPSHLHVTDVPAPTPGPGEVIVRMHAAGLNPIDYKMRDGSSGQVARVTDADFPMVLGREGSGVVAEVGEGVHGLAVGDTVFGMLPFGTLHGTYAELVAFPADALAAAPPSVPASALAGATLVALTAYDAVHDKAQVTAGEVVLVHGAAGGVGQVVVQLAVAAGAHVYGTASATDADYVRELGATFVDRDTDWRAETPRPDVIVDCVYFGTYEPSLDHLAEGGRLVELPTLADRSIGAARGIDVLIPGPTITRERLDAIAAGVGDGTLRIRQGRQFPLAEAAQAHELLEHGRPRGKLTLRITD